MDDINNVDGFFIDIDEETGDIEMIDMVDGEIVGNSLTNYVTGEEMTEIQAIEITNSIRAAGTALYVLIAKAHQGKAYKSLGYNSFETYVRQEFDISRNRAYQLLDQSKIIESIEAATPDGTQVVLTEAQARDIKRELPNITEKIEEETTGKTPEESKEIVENIVKDEREKINEKKKEEKDSYNAYDDNNENKNTGSQGAPNGDNVDNVNIDDFDSIETTVNNVDAALSSNSSDEDDMSYDGKIQSRPTVIDDEVLYKFMNFLDIVESLPNVHSFLGSLSANQKKIVSQKSLVASDYLNELLDELAIREMSR